MCVCVCVCVCVCYVCVCVRACVRACVRVWQPTRRCSFFKHMQIMCSLSVHGGWSQWAESGRTECSKTCGTGSLTITETRTCTNPPPSGRGARPCSGDSSRTSTADCKTQACPGKSTDFVTESLSSHWVTLERRTRRKAKQRLRVVFY